MSATLAFALMLSPQAAPSAADLADAKCVGAMTLVEGHAEAKDKPGMNAAIMFYLGKIAGRSGNAAIGPALKALVEQTKAEGPDSIAAAAIQCGIQFEQATRGM